MTLLGSHQSRKQSQPEDEHQNAEKPLEDAKPPQPEDANQPEEEKGGEKMYTISHGRKSNRKFLRKNFRKRTTAKKYAKKKKLIKPFIFKF